MLDDFVLSLSSLIFWWYYSEIISPFSLIEKSLDSSNLNS